MTNNICYVFLSSMTYIIYPMKKDIIFAKARLSLIYFTSEMIFCDIKQCEEAFELDDFIEVYDIIREWSFMLEARINKIQLEKQNDFEKEFDIDDEITPELEKLMNAFCILNEDSILIIAELMDKQQYDLISRATAWLFVPNRNIKKLLLLSELLVLISFKKCGNCKMLLQLYPVVKEAIAVVREAYDCVEDLRF